MKKFLLSIFAVMLAVFSVQAQSYVYKKVTSAPADWSGDYLIVYEDGNVAFDGNLTKLDAVSNTISVAISNGKITADSNTNSAKFTIAKSGTSYTIKSASGYYIGAASNANTLNASYSEMLNTISWEDESPKIVGAKGAVLRYNATSGQTRFRYFKSGTYTNQKAIALYKFTESGSEEGGTTEPEQPEIPVETVAAPIITPESTTFNEDESVFVSITTETPDAKIYYTLDSTDPSDKNGELYESEIEITETTTVKAIAVKDGCNDSEVAEATYTKIIIPATGEVATVTGNATVNYGTTTIEGIEKFEVAPITLAFAKNNGTTAPAYNKAGDCRIYAKGSITATCTVGNLTKIVFTVSAQGKKRLTDLTPSTGTVTIAEDHSTITWEGNASEVVMTVGEKAVYGTDGPDKAGQICFTGFTATYAIPNLSHTLSVSKAGYATLFLDFAATIPAEVEAYIVKADGINKDFVTLTQVKGVLPANTGVIIKAKEGNYDFVASTETPADVTGNLLEGSVTDKNIEREAYVLGVVDGVVGLYKALASGTSWLNNANRAYLPAVPGASGSASLRFNFGGTTAIEEVETEAAETVIYDLTGRRVNEITKAGVYIINGHKVLVK